MLGFGGREAAKPTTCGLSGPVTKVLGSGCSQALIRNEQRNLEPQLGPPAGGETLPQVRAFVVGAPDPQECSGKDISTTGRIQEGRTLGDKERAHLTMTFLPWPSWFTWQGRGGGEGEDS